MKSFKQLRESKLTEALYDVSWGIGTEKQVIATDPSDAIRKAKALILRDKPKLSDPKYADTWKKNPTVHKIREEAELDEDISKMSHGRLKWHMNTGTPHGSYSNSELKKERDRRLKYRDSADAYKKAKAGLSEEVELDEAKTDVYHKHMLKALGKSSLPKNHSYTSAIANNGDFVVKDGGGRVVGRIAKGEHNLKEAELDEISKKTLGSYINKASADRAQNAYKMGKEGGINFKGLKRSQGIQRAVKRLTKEESPTISKVKEEAELDESRDVKQPGPHPDLVKAKIKHDHVQSPFKKSKTWVTVDKKDYEKAKKVLGDKLAANGGSVYLAMEEKLQLGEAVMSGKEKEAFEAGKKAARAGKPYSDNPHKDANTKLAWSKGHNQAKARKLGVREEVSLDEVLDSPEKMDRYKAKAKYSKDRAASSAAAKILRGKDAGGNRADHSPELKTMAKREKGLKMVDKAAMRKTFKALRKEEVEDDMPASPDEYSMALKQLEFIEYAAEEMMDHIKAGGAFPEWFQNKLSKAHGEIEGLHSSMGEHGGDDDEEEMK